MRKMLLAGAAVIALGMFSGNAAAKLDLPPGAYDAMAEQQIRCTRTGCRTLRPGCRIVRNVTRGRRVVCERPR
jgi:hypothetical protein